MGRLGGKLGTHREVLVADSGKCDIRQFTAYFALTSPASRDAVICFSHYKQNST